MSLVKKKVNVFGVSDNTGIKAEMAAGSDSVQSARLNRPRRGGTLGRADQFYTQTRRRAKSRDLGREQ